MLKLKMIICWVLLTASFALLVSCGESDRSTNPSGNADADQTSKDIVFSVSFSGTDYPSISVKNGEQLKKPADPEKDGYIFGGWYIDSKFGEEASFPITISNNTTLYARFYDYRSAFAIARDKTVSSAGFEYDYTISASASYSVVSAKGNTVGKSQYSTKGDITFYDEHTNSGILFIDNSKYLIKSGSELKKVTVNKKGKVTDSSVEPVASTYKYDSSSFAKALFEYSDDQLKSIEATENPNEYKLITSFNYSQAIALVGNYVNSDTIKKLIGELPETSVDTGMYVTFLGGEVKTYRYEIHIDVSSIKFELIYNLKFNDVGQAKVITPKTFD